MEQDRQRPAGFMARLARDRRGNTLAMMAAALIPLAAFCGCAIDSARLYVVKTRLQQACDAGVLAGRKFMTDTSVGNTTLDATATAQAQTFFNNNFRTGWFKTSTASFNPSKTSDAQVAGTAQAVVPMTILSMFGVPSQTINVTCQASYDVADTDVIFVLDTTGSMACDVNGNNCNSGSSSKIVGLRAAVRSFYQTVASAVTDKANTRIRFGFVPYGMTVNAKNLLTSGAMPTSYFADSAPYQTMMVKFSTSPTYVTVNGVRQARYLAIAYKYIQSTIPVSDFKGFGNVALGTGVTLYTQSNGWWGYSDNASSATYVTNQPSSSNPYYNLRDLAIGTNVTGTVGNLTTTNSSWGGCIEERATVPQLSMSPIPSGATDMDLTSAPTNDDTRWKPYLADLEYYRSNYTTSTPDTTSVFDRQVGYCPSPMMPFTTVDTTAPNTVPNWLNTYLNGLIANGGTYHDIGMIWGGRLGNPSGIFAANVNAGNLSSVSRHIIFMTDGTMENYPSNYTAWGVTAYDGRDAPTNTSNTSLVNYHNNRFLAACNTVKAMGYTIWVIGFGQTLTPQMTSCATAGRAYYASDTSKLTTTFQYIAGQVADLRINK